MGRCAAPAASRGHLHGARSARPRAPADDEYLWLRRRRGHPAAAAGYRLERRYAQGHAAEDWGCLHAAPIAGRGQGAGTLSSQGPAAEHADQARVRAHEDAVWPAERIVRGSPYPCQTRKGGRAGCPYLGSHVLRQSNAARQLDLGTRPRVLSDLLGHRDPESISAYVRIASESLRDVSLPVPT